MPKVQETSEGKFYPEDKVMENIKDLYRQYSDQIISWYNGLEQFYQYGVLFLLIVLSFFIAASVFLSRITK
jgi:hypothetical protein